jgi:hypothetical protein
MKAKKIISEKHEQPSPLPAPSNEEREDQLAGWQQSIVALAEARLSLDGEQDVVFQMHERAIGLCRVVEDLAIGDPKNEISLRALGKVMEVVQEDIEVAKWITMGKPRHPRWF